MSTLTANTIRNGILAQLPLVRCDNQRDGRTSVSRSQPVGLCSGSLPYGDRRQAILSSGTRYPTLVCSLTRSRPIGIESEALPYGGRRQGTMNTRLNHGGLVCFAALNARCGAEQTQTITRESSTITVAPVDGKSELSPKIDDGGSGFPPRDDDDGGGGGGGGGGNWSGGFFFFGFLAFLGFLKDQEQEGPYSDDR
uniref:Uncharacterized protein n=1 Tax=Kalanchoe fedtschenkoi TaxID=63787 RepID=A0A7N0TSZ5_KALFE